LNLTSLITRVTGGNSGIACGASPGKPVYSGNIKTMQPADPVVALTAVLLTSASVNDLSDGAIRALAWLFVITCEIYIRHIEFLKETA